MIDNKILKVSGGSYNMRELETIVIPSGNFKDDIERFDKGLEYSAVLKKQGKKVRYILSGIGPDLNERLKQENRVGKNFFDTFEGTNELDVHPELWNRAVELARINHGFTAIVYPYRIEVLSRKNIEPFGIDILSRNSVENLVNTFPTGTEGNYTIFSRKFYNSRFKLIEKRGRAEGYFSENLRINYIDTNHKYSLIGVSKDVFHLMKDFFFGKEKVLKMIVGLKN